MCKFIMWSNFYLLNRYQGKSNWPALPCPAWGSWYFFFYWGQDRATAGQARPGQASQPLGCFQSRAESSRVESS